MGWSRATCLPLAAAAFAFSITVDEAAARSRALLIGASDYTVNAGVTDLNGPRNDVTMMWRYLKSIGYADEDMVVLTDLLPPTADFPKMKSPATHRAIIDELDALASHSYDSGDLVVVFYAGHGTTVPDQNPGEELLPEAKGRDQVILPVDVGVAGPDGQIPNAIVDDELGRKLDAIRARGVDVWAVIDACNSGGGTRGGEVARYVDPAVLGITGELPPPASVSRGDPPPVMVDVSDPQPGKGRLAAFFAVDAFNLAYEKEFAFADYQQPLAGDTARERKLGVFSNYLHRALMTGQSATFGELFQEVVAGIAADPVNSSNPRPVAEGALDMAVPGTDGARGMLRAVLDKSTETPVLRIPAGVFDGFDIDAVVTIYDPDDPERALATGRVSSATAANSLVSRLRWVDSETSRLPWTKPFPVRVTKRVTSFSYKLALPDNLDALSEAERARIVALLEAAVTVPEGQTDPGVTLAAAGAEDVNLATRVEDGSLWFFQPHAEVVKDPDAFGKTLELSLDAADADLVNEIRLTAWQHARAEKLVRLAFNEGRSPDPAKLTFDASRFRDGERAMDPRGECEPLETTLGPDEIARSSRIGVTNTTDVGNCDVIRIAAANTSESDQYHVGAFYVDARGGIQSMDLHGASEDVSSTCSWLLPPKAGRDMTFQVQIVTWNDEPLPVGIERIVILALKRDATGLPPNLCALQQPTLEATRSMRSGSSDLDTLLEGIVGGTRGGNVTRVARPARVEMAAYVFELAVRP